MKSAQFENSGSIGNFFFALGILKIKTKPHFRKLGVYHAFHDLFTFAVG